MAKNVFILKCYLIGLFLFSTDFVICQTKIFTVDSINFNEWKYNQRKIVRSPEIEIIAESIEGIFYSNNLSDAVKIFNGKNAALAVDSNSKTHIVYEDNGIKYSYRNDTVSWVPSILISDSTEISYSPIADCDREGNLHVLYGVKDSSDNGSTHLSSFKYVKISEGQQQISSIIYEMNEEDNQDTLVKYTIATDLLFKDKAIFIVFELSNDSIYVIYSRDNGESWVHSLTFSGFNPSLSVGFGHYPYVHGYYYPPFNDQTLIEESTLYPVVMYFDNDSNLMYRYAQFSITSKIIYWYEERKLHDGPIDYVCIDDIIIAQPFGYSYIFQKRGALYHAFTDFHKSFILDTITEKAIVSSIAYRLFNFEKVDIVWYENNGDSYEMYYQDFEKTGPIMKIDIISQSTICTEFCDHLITVNVLGGIPPYYVTLSGFGPFSYMRITKSDSLGEFRFDSLCAGSYNLRVNDAIWSQITTEFELGDSFIPVFLTIDSINNVSCLGRSDGSINLTTSGGTMPFSYLWSTGETTEDLDSLKAGKYWVSITDGNGCIKTDTIIILEPPAVTTGELKGNTTVQQFSIESYTLNDTISGSTYYWETTGGSIISGQGSDSIKVQWGSIGIGIVNVIEIDNDGCNGDTVSLEVEIGSTDIRLTHEKSLKIYPNPFANTAIISLNMPDVDSYTLYLKDLSGKTVRIIENITEGKTEITRDGLPAGLYLLELRGPNIYRRKIIIQ